MKRLIICCDGTWQCLDNPYPSNVIKIAQAIKGIADDGTPQIVFYDEGVGTESALKKLVGGAFGWGIDKNIQEAYRFLSLNYLPGDEVYLFGWSRGAYTVRSLAGMIYCSGLVSRPSICNAVKAYELYRNPKVKPSSSEAQAFRQANGDNIPITLLGCWDTVGALGVPDQLPFLPIDTWLNKKYRFHDTQLSRIIQHAFHGVAIDELRTVFDVTPMQQSPNNPNQVLKQVWFPGDHGCIGGGSEHKCNLSDGPLQWMMEEIQNIKLGLSLDASTIPTGVNPDFIADFDNTPKGVYRLMSQKEREILGSFDDLHQGAKQRWKRRQDYRPRNLADKHGKELSFWEATIAGADLLLE
jgi:uncharacterized protein (DUF2235 family)